MTAVAYVTNKTVFDKQIDAFDRAAPAPRFESLRQAAREQFQRLPLPTRRTEDWRFTSLTPLLNVPFVLGEPASVPASALPVLPAPDALRVVLVNGAFDRSLSSP